MVIMFDYIEIFGLSWGEVKDAGERSWGVGGGEDQGKSRD